MKDIPEESKIDVLLNLLDAEYDYLRASEEREQTIFQWTTNLLLVSFGGLVALSNRSTPLPDPFWVKLLASVLIAMPAMFSTIWMVLRMRRSAKDAGAIDRIQELLHLFDDGYYGGTESAFPPSWKRGYGRYIPRRWETRYYMAVMTLMTVCVVTTLWLLL